MRMGRMSSSVRQGRGRAGKMDGLDWRNDAVARQCRMLGCVRILNRTSRILRSEEVQCHNNRLQADGPPQSGGYGWYSRKKGRAGSIGH